MLIEWKGGIGYGDFVTGLCYAHSWRIKSKESVEFVIHWKANKGFLYNKNDPETILERFEYIKSILVPVDNLNITHKFNSAPEYRFINQFDEFNPLHGIWYNSLKKTQEKSNKVVVWTTKNNTEFPGIRKDPVNRYWETIIKILKFDGYDVIEVDYRTPIKELINHIKTCSFGVGYKGMAYQLFKIMWKPLIVFTTIKNMTQIAIPWAYILDSPEKFINSDYTKFIKKSFDDMLMIEREHKIYLTEYVDVKKHELYNKQQY